MNKIYDYFPNLVNMSFADQQEAVVRMCIAHVLNGGSYVSLYETALEYLKGLQS